MRMRTTCTIAMMALALIATGCSNDDGPIDATSPGSIAGRVTTGSGESVAGAMVTTTPATQSKFTGADGTFSIPDVAPGTYVVAVTKEGLNPGTVSVTVTAGKAASADVVLGSGPANASPVEPGEPTPSDGAIAQPTELTLRWSASDPDEDTLRFDVLFGTSNPPTTVVTTSQLQRVHYVSGLDSNTTYYWQVIAKDGRGGATSSPVWRFRTEKPNENKAPQEPTATFPANNATDVGIPVQLAWNAIDPEFDQLKYDVYFGTTESPTRVALDIPQTTLVRTGLLPNATYFWRVVARDNHGGETAGPLWKFSTGSTPGQPGGDLVAYFQLDGDAGDATGRGHNGVNHGATPTEDRHGVMGGALNFANRAFISVPHDPELNFSGSFTIAAWVRLSGSQSDYTGLVAKGPENTAHPGYMLLIKSGNVVGTATGQPGYVVTTGGSSLNDGRWHHVALVTDASSKTVYLYVDGSLVRSETDPNLQLEFDTTRPLFIGVERNEEIYYKGAMDDVRLYSKKLAGSEIQALANQ